MESFINGLAAVTFIIAAIALVIFVAGDTFDVDRDW